MPKPGMTKYASLVLYELNKHNPHVFARSGAPERTPPSAENFRESAAREIPRIPRSSPARKTRAPHRAAARAQRIL